MCITLQNKQAYICGTIDKYLTYVYGNYLEFLTHTNVVYLKSQRINKFKFVNYPK